MERYRPNTTPQGYGRSRQVPVVPSAAPVVPVGRAAAEVLAGDRFPLAMAYVPWQYWTETYPLEKALRSGTLFCELDKPFVGRRACK